MINARMGFLAVAAILCLTGPALAQSGAPDATLTLSSDSVAAGVGYSWGHGILHYHGKDYPVSVQGLSVGAVGAARADAVGDVYGMRNLQDFSGNYFGVGVGATLAGGGSVASLKNEHGVIIHIESTTQGLGLNIGTKGIHLALD